MNDELLKYVPTKTDIKIFNIIFEKGFYSPPNAQSKTIKKLERLGIVEYRDDFKGVHFTEIGKQLSPKWFYPLLYSSIGLAVSKAKFSAVKKGLASNFTVRQSQIHSKASEDMTEIDKTIAGSLVSSDTEVIYKRYRIRKAASLRYKAHRKNQPDQRGPDMPDQIGGDEVVFYYKTNYEKHGLTKDKADYQDIMDEYAVAKNDAAQSGLMVYYKNKGDATWNVNPWSTRFLIRILLENIGIPFPPTK